MVTTVTPTTLRPMAAPPVDHLCDLCVTICGTCPLNPQKTLKDVLVLWPPFSEAWSGHGGCGDRGALDN
jgi:hypothetical protein